MASYQSRRREPLLDQPTQAMLEQRGHELMGLGLLVLAAVVLATLGSYSPADPGWMVSTDTPVANWLGRPGAAVASTLFVIGGRGVWGIPLILGLWGLRFLLHRGAERVLARSVFAVIAVALGSVFAATHVPPADWPHPAIGLGGLFGDTVLGAVLTFLPFGAAFALKTLSVVLAVAVVWLYAFVTGFDRAETVAVGRFLLTGLVTGYDAVLRATRAGAAAGLRGAVSVAQARAAARAVARVRAAQPAAAAEALPDDLRPAPLRAGPGLRADRRRPDPAEPAPGRSLLAGLMRRAVGPQPAEAEAMPGDEADPDQRLRARIGEAIRARAAIPAQPPVPTQRREPPLLRAAIPMAAPPSLPETPAPAPAAEDEDTPAVFGWPETEPSETELVDDEPAFLRHPPVPAEPRRLVQAASPKPVAPSTRALAETQPSLRFDDPAGYEFPPLSLLASPVATRRSAPSEEALEENARMLESVLDDYGVKGEITSVRPGPVVTMYELEPAPGLKASRVIGLADDIARSMSALAARVSTVPGRSVIGIELPNATREKVLLREILSHRDFGDSQQRLPLALGKDIGGDPVIANLAKMPHLLIAGTTGSGKSVAINTMILSLLYKLTPEECRLIMIDPKMLELSVYDGIPHLLSPVVTDPKKAVVALKWVVGEMEERYRKMSKMGVRNIEGYNGRVREALAKGEMFRRTIQTGFDDDTGDPVFETEEFAPVAIPYIVVVVDEMADLMMVAGKEIEACIQRLAQMARASGIHLIMATQRPSVDVITGTIKANFPTRISFQVTSKIDSRTILGEQGAEQLLGMGDMLYMAGGAKITRIHGPFVSDEEVEEIVNHLKSFGPPSYMAGVVDGPDEDAAQDIDAVLGLATEAGDDALYDQAVAIVARDRKCSTSYIQRKLGIGYNKAARLVEQMEDQGVVTRANHVGKREILVEER
jgi:S-DNA-T family DNA segregation ATPase FtsK/SpoIIIE